MPHAHGSGRRHLSPLFLFWSPAEVKKSFDAMVEAEAAFKADLEKLLKNEGHMPEDKYLLRGPGHG
jgi:hypothetical protein